LIVVLFQIRIGCPSVLNTQSTGESTFESEKIKYKYFNVSARKNESI
jgi:hypothetical protein